MMMMMMMMMMMESRRVRRAEHVEYMAEMRNAYKILVGKHEKTDHLGDLPVDWRFI
jgi:hypothetical protein